MSRCKTCRREIVWAKTSTGATMPVDAKPDPSGILLMHNGQVEFAEYAPTSWPDGPRYTSHFATCANAASHRKRTQ